MIKTLTKHGNSLALVIEKPVLELIGANANTALLVNPKLMMRFLITLRKFLLLRMLAWRPHLK